jgi:dipeptidase E
MFRSGLHALLGKRLGEENFLYAGYSAGACVAGPTLDGLHIVDDPDVVPEGYQSEVEWTGLSL